MDSEAAAVLIHFFSEIDIFILIFVRILAFFIIIPVISSANIPNQIKIALAVVISYLLFISGKVDGVYYDDNIVSYVLLIVKEFLVGFTAGFVVNMIFTIFYFAGQLMDYQIGFAMVSVLDPLSQIQVPITGNLLYLFMSILLVASGGLNAFISAFFYSYDAVPIGAADILANQTLMMYMLDVLTRFFIIGVSIAMPIVGAILILDVALGVLVKAVPQMNIFVVGMPMKLLAGLLVFVLMVPVFGSIYDFVFNESYRHIINIIDGMSP